MAANLKSSNIAKGWVRRAFSQRGIIAAGCILAFGVAIRISRVKSIPPPRNIQM